MDLYHVNAMMNLHLLEDFMILKHVIKSRLLITLRRSLYLMNMISKDSKYKADRDTIYNFPAKPNGDPLRFGDSMHGGHNLGLNNLNSL